MENSSARRLRPPCRPACADDRRTPTRTVSQCSVFQGSKSSASHSSTRSFRHSNSLAWGAPSPRSERSLSMSLTCSTLAAFLMKKAYFVSKILSGDSEWALLIHNFPATPLKSTVFRTLPRHCPTKENRADCTPAGMFAEDACPSSLRRQRAAIRGQPCLTAFFMR